MLNLAIPHIGTPFLDQNGKVSREWFLFLAGLLQVLGGPVINAGVSSITPLNLSLTSNITGVLTVTNGGTGISSTVASALLYAPAANTVSSLAVGANSILTSNASSAPSWNTTIPAHSVNGTVTATTIVGTTVSAITVSAGTVNAGTVSTSSVKAISVSAVTVSATQITVSTTVLAGGTVRAANSLGTIAGGVTSIYIGSAGLAVSWGSGVPALLSDQGSLYLRTDGTTTNDRIYMMGPASTWIGIVTAT